MIERSKVATVVAEALGSALLTYMVLAISRSGLGISYFIASAVAASFALVLLVAGPTVKGYFNPVATLGLWTLRKLQTVEAAVYMAAQFLGAVGASALFVYISDQKLQSIAEKNFDWRILTAEAAGALVFGMGVAAAIYRGYDTVKTATTMAVALFAGILVAGAASNGLVNPAVALGLQSWSKSYVIGPIVGTVVGMNLYSLLYAPVASVAGVAATKKAVVAKKRPAAKKRK